MLMLFMGGKICAQSGNSLSKAKKHQYRRVIDQLENQWRLAILKGDANSLSGLLADDYMAITPSGTLQTKDQTLDNFSSGRWRFTTLDITDRKVRFYGRTALVTSVADVQASTPEGDLSGNYRYTRVYARDLRGNWKIVNFEANRIDQQSSRK